MKRIRQILVFLTLFVIVCESVCRLFVNPVYITHDELKGFRGATGDISQIKGLKIALLGDSFTYGSKVEDNETISFYLTDFLKKKLKREDIFTDNFGIPGTSSIEHYYIFTRHVAGSDYDFVVLNFFIDDFTPYYYNNSILNPYIYCRDFEKGPETLMYYLNHLKSVELSMVYIDLLLTYRRAGAPLTPVSYMLQKMREKDSLRFRCAGGYLQEMGRKIRERGKKGIFLLIPSLTLYDYQNPYPEEIADYETYVMLVAKKSGFEVIDSLTELRDLLDQRFLVKNDIHYNGEGYRFIAGLISDRITEMLKR
ncbi:MAG: SGNH/GDSL hydrolase family protein [Deltaproteobacteria bacterium]|nr:SGNH/GDSL hydrolase family protein [Deltaproteobacteria bacterium]